MHPTGADLIAEALAAAIRPLRDATARDWSAPAGRLSWSCRETADHLTGCLFFYAAQLASRVTDGPVPLRISVDAGTDADGLVQSVETAGSVLAAAVRTTPPGVRAWHVFPHHSADANAFAAMGTTEILTHTHDIAEGLRIEWEPPAVLCEAVLSRIFPDVRPGNAPWPTLLWATGRGDLPNRPRPTEWRWHNAATILTDRTELREISPAVARDLRYGGTGGFDWAAGGPFQGTLDACGMLLKAYEAGTLRPGWGVYVIVRTADERAVGAVGFHTAPDEDGRVEIGYDLVETARGHGYATEAVRALSLWALEQPGARVLLATVDRANTASQAVLTRAGYHQLPLAPLPEADEDEDTYLYEFTGRS